MIEVLDPTTASDEVKWTFAPTWNGCCSLVAEKKEYKMLQSRWKQDQFPSYGFVHVHYNYAFISFTALFIYFWLKLSDIRVPYFPCSYNRRSAGWKYRRLFGTHVWYAHCINTFFITVVLDAFNINITNNCCI